MNMHESKREWARDEWRLKLVGIEQDIAAMRCELKRLDGVRERLLSEMEMAVNSCAVFRGRDLRMAQDKQNSRRTSLYK